jgi:hypothetical protein
MLTAHLLWLALDNHTPATQPSASTKPCIFEKTPEGRHVNENM